MVNYLKQLISEFKAGLLIAFAASFLMVGYELVRSPVNAIFKSHYGMENWAAVNALMPLGVLAVLAVYGRLLSAYGTQKTLFLTSLFSSIGLALCYLLLYFEFKPIAWILFIFKEAYIVLLIEQFWSFINSTYKAATVKKFSGFILAISSIGNIIGGVVVGLVASKVGSLNLVLVGAVVMIPAIVLPQWAFRWAGEPVAEKEKITSTTKDHMGFKALLSSPLLLTIFGLIIMTQILSTAASFKFDWALNDFLPNTDQQAAYSGFFFSQVNAVAMVIQIVFIPLAFRYLRSASIHLALPLINLAAGAVALFYPSLTTISIAFLIFKAVDYSIFRVAKEVLYIPLSFNARYRAKEIIDVFGYRASKGGTSLIVATVERMGIALATYYSWIAFAAAAGWTALALCLPQATRAEETRSSTAERVSG